MKILCYPSTPPGNFTGGGGALAVWYGFQALANVPGLDVTIAYPGDSSMKDLVERVPHDKLIPIKHQDELPGLIKQLSPDLFHTVGGRMYPILKYCRKHGIPTVFEVRAPQFHPCKLIHKLLPPYHRQWRSMLFLRRDRKAALMASHVIVPSKSALEGMRTHYGITGERSDFFYNGSDHDIFKPDLSLKKKEPDPVIVNAGRIEWDRNFDLSIRVFHRIKRHFPGARMEIAGHGNLEESVKEMCVREKIGDVIFHGNIPHRELARLYQKGALLLNASQSESFGNVVAEAMACGLPVVCFKAGSLNELVQDGQSGLLCDLLDEEQLYRKALELLQDPARLQQMGSFAAVSAHQRFSWEKRAFGIAELYKRLLSGNRG